MNDRAILLKMLAVLTEIRDLLKPPAPTMQVLTDIYPGPSTVHHPRFETKTSCGTFEPPVAVWSGTLQPSVWAVGPSHPCESHAHVDPEADEERTRRRNRAIYEKLAAEIRSRAPPPIVLSDPSHGPGATPHRFNPCMHPDLRALDDGISCPECGWNLREEDFRIGHGG